MSTNNYDDYKLQATKLIRNTSNELLLTQVDVFEEGSANDAELFEANGLDLQSHEDIFHVIYEKVYITLSCALFFLLWDRF